jgi:hypothetical protein
MIRINLLRTTSKKRSQIHIPVGAIVKTLAAVVLAAGIAASVWYGIRFLKNRPAKESTIVMGDNSPAVPNGETVAQEAGQSGDTDFEPSSPTKQKMVEDVVSDIPEATGKDAGSVLARLSYSEMSRGEQINYEFTFAKNVLQILTRAVPEGIGFSSFSIDSFQTVSAQGVAPSREQVTSLFSSLRREKFELSTPPRSTIRPSGRQGFKFVFSCDVPLGSNPAEPWLLTDHLESRTQLGTYVRAFAKTASRTGVVLTHGLTHVRTYQSGSWRRSVYHFSGRGNYRNFVRFVLQLNLDRIPCAFSMMHLRARSGGSVDISADIVFTTRE